MFQPPLFPGVLHTQSSRSGATHPSKSTAQVHFQTSRSRVLNVPTVCSPEVPSSRSQGSCATHPSCSTMGIQFGQPSAPFLLASKVHCFAVSHRSTTINHFGYSGFESFNLSTLVSPRVLSPEVNIDDVCFP
jgi:hypothetical protein